MIQCFPLDNTDYEAMALGAWCGTRTRGVFSDDSHFAVAPNGGMTVTLSPGLAWLKADVLWGLCIYDTNSAVLPIEPADGALTRWAAVCLRLDKALNEGAVAIKYGPFSVNPDINTLPPPEQGGLYYDEIYVAAIRIRAGATEITSADITDLRLNEFYCGVMRDGVTRIPTQMLDDAWRSWAEQTQTAFDEWASESRDEFELWAETSRTEFETWVETIQDILDEEVAGQLLLLIQNLEAKSTIVAFHDPTPGTHGEVGQFYINADTRALFGCVGAESGFYSWVKFVGGGAPSGAAVLGASYIGASYLMSSTQ